MDTVCCQKEISLLGIQRVEWNMSSVFSWVCLYFRDGQTDSTATCCPPFFLSALPLLLASVCSPMSDEVRRTHLSLCTKPTESLMLTLLHTTLCSRVFETPSTARSSATRLLPQHSLQESLRENILSCSGILRLKDYLLSLRDCLGIRRWMIRKTCSNVYSNVSF